MTPVRWTDNHCHLPDDLGAAAELVASAREAGVERFVDVGCDVPGSRAAIDRAAAIDGVWATAGVHPHDAKTLYDADGRFDLGPLREAASQPGVVAIGECGLDHHYDHSPREQQHEVFVAQIHLARELGLPLVIHTREAWPETFAILDAEGVPERTVFHCFTGGPDEARAGLDRGIVLSFSGIVTFPSAPELREAAVLCPIDRLMVETDSPYLAPVPHRGRRNRPEHVTLVGAAVAEAKGVPVGAVADATWETASAFYGLDA